MPIVDYPYNLLRGLSDFWQRFFADADQLDALYRGTAILVGQAYLDYLSTVLAVSLKDANVFDKEYYRLITISEDEVAFEEGATAPANRWAFKLPDSVVNFASLDNRVVEPTASLEPNLDFEIVDGMVQFHVDPTDPLGTGVPLAGYARRAIDVETGGKFTDSGVADWTTTAVRKGDTLRILDVGTNGTQRKRADYPIVLVRADGLYVSASTPLPAAATGVNYVIVRVPPSPTVIAESFTTAASAATFAHTRLDVGSVRVFAKAPAGNDVVEGVDYVLNYESGSILALTTWQNMVAGVGTFSVDYTWREEVWPSAGASPRLATTGVIVSTTVTTRVLQIALWAPDALVDRMTLANNFGSFIGRQQPSSETYRAFLEGIFQLYVLGPVLERVESALNVILGMPVVRDDGEIFQRFDTSDSLVDRAITTRPSSGLTATYEFPKGTPFRTDLVFGQSLLSFEPFTTAVTVTDYIQTPNWWYRAVIPEELFSGVDVRLDIGRRTASPNYVPNIINPPDGAVIGDPGLIIGADETGFIPAVQPAFRHRLAFVMMDRYFKYHTFQVTFDATALSAATGAGFAQGLKDLNDLVLASRPAHTYPFTTPTTFFRDEIQVVDNDISFDRLVGSRLFGPDSVIGYDNIIYIGLSPTIIGLNSYTWNVGDYFKYELFTASVVFPFAYPLVGSEVTLPNAPASPRRRRLVKVFVDATVGGQKVIEFQDYTVNYDTCTVTRMTAWDVTTVNVTFRQLNIGNLADAPAGLGDMPILINGVDPALVHAAYSATAYEWDGTTDVLAPRDISMVERALIVSAH